MQIVWNGTPYPHGWQFGLAGPNEVLYVAGGGVITIITLDICTTTTRSLMPVRTSQSLMPARASRSLMPVRSTRAHCEDA